MTRSVTNIFIDRDISISNSSNVISSILSQRINCLCVFTNTVETNNIFCFVDRCLSFCTFPFGHRVVCSSSIYGFWLPLWYLQTLLEVEVREYYSIYSFMCMFCRSLFVLLSFSFGHCVVCSSSIYGFWLPLWYLQTLLAYLFFSM